MRHCDAGEVYRTLRHGVGSDCGEGGKPSPGCIIPRDEESGEETFVEAESENDVLGMLEDEVECIDFGTIGFVAKMSESPFPMGWRKIDGNPVVAGEFIVSGRVAWCIVERFGRGFAVFRVRSLMEIDGGFDSLFTVGEDEETSEGTIEEFSLSGRLFSGGNAGGVFHAVVFEDEVGLRFETFPAGDGFLECEIGFGGGVEDAVGGVVIVREEGDDDVFSEDGVEIVEERFSRDFLDLFSRADDFPDIFGFPERGMESRIEEGLDPAGLQESGGIVPEVLNADDETGLGVDEPSERVRFRPVSPRGRVGEENESQQEQSAGESESHVGCPMPV